mmetsp:Transcript_17566/g.26589  ORF Transcript_17566/g.26589 Transcript_17566/m.26589 type:complete len:542 (+) Transcript_17566:48-1673(+)
MVVYRSPIFIKLVWSPFFLFSNTNGLLFPISPFQQKRAFSMPACNSKPFLPPNERLATFCRATTEEGVEHNITRADLHGSDEDRADIEDEIILPGKHKWLGGAVDPVDGTIYGIPSHATQVVCLTSPKHSSKPTLTPDLNQNKEVEEYEMNEIILPKQFANGKFKWLRGIIWKGYLYGIPAWSNEGILRVDIDRYWGRRQEGTFDEEDAIASVIPFPEGAIGVSDSVASNSNASKNVDGEVPRRWLWHGAAMNKNQTAIYAIPSNAHHVLKLDLLTQTTSLLPIPATITPLTQTNKWYGGILGEDNAIYGVPYAASGLLRVDANTDKVELIGEEKFGVREYNWHGGVKGSNNGKIYCFPSHNSHVLCVDTSIKISAGEERMSLLPIYRAPYDHDQVTRYKWLGGSTGRDGNIYGMPSDASSILRIDTKKDIVTTFGRVGGEKNKYQGGTLGNDGLIYAIPSDADNILCIDTDESGEESKINGISYLNEGAAFTIGDKIPDTKDKWQGGFLGNDGSIYCIPENFNRIMKVVPNKMNSKISFL